jgi:hypothetical protein
VRWGQGRPNDESAVYAPPPESNAGWWRTRADVAKKFYSSHADAYDFLVVHPARLAREYVAFFNLRRPHEGIAQRTPIASATASAEGKVIAHPVLGGLHHDYRRAA